MLHEFLKLLQAIESGRKCEGKDHHEIRETDVARAEHTSNLRMQHSPDVAVPGHETVVCEMCREIEAQEIALRESFHAQGIDLPLEVLVDV